MNPYTARELVTYLRQYWKNAVGIHYGQEHEIMKCAADEIERLRSIVRVNGLRWGHTHEQIDAILDGPDLVTTGDQK